MVIAPWWSLKRREGKVDSERTKGNPGETTDVVDWIPRSEYRKPDVTSSSLAKQEGAWATWVSSEVR